MCTARREPPWKGRAPRNVAQIDASIRMVASSESNTCRCRGGSSFRNVPARLAFSVLVYFFENAVVFLCPFIRKCPGTTPQPLAPRLGTCDRGYADFDLLAFIQAQIFGQFNSAAANRSVDGLRHDCPSVARILPPLMILVASDPSHGNRRTAAGFGHSSGCTFGRCRRYRGRSDRLGFRAAPTGLRI